MIDFPKIPNSVTIDGIEYSYVTINDLAPAERPEVIKLTQQVGPLLLKLDTGELNEEEANKLDADLKRLADLFLQKAPAEVRERLSWKQRIELLKPVWRQAMKDAGLSLS